MPFFEHLETEKGADFSPCRKWRYKLWRIWNKDKPYVAFCGLNPSKADENINDSTVRKCIKFAINWGFGGMYMMNAFAFRATLPMVMYEFAESGGDPIGKGNNLALEEVFRGAGQVVLAWGNMIRLDRNRADFILDMLKRLNVAPYCFSITNQGQPQHPLYIRNTTTLIPYVRSDS